jgi:parallel beta-helix repeat protein
MKRSELPLGVAACAFVLTLAAGSAHAADCGDTSGPLGVDQPCSCGDTVTTNTLLDPSDPVNSADPSDVCAGIGLSVNAGVNLRLGGVTIRGNGGGNGIEVFGDNVTLSEGNVTGFIDGINVNPAANNLTITNMHVIQNSQRGIDWNTITNSLIQYNEVSGNGNYAIGSLTDPAADTTGTTISNNTMVGNGAGIVIVHLSNNFFRSNQFASNGGAMNLGLVTVPANGNLVELNQSQRDAGGIQVDGNSNTIRGNAVQLSGLSGIGAFGNSNTVDNNTTHTNAQVGISIVGDGNIVTRSRGKNNRCEAILVQGNGNSILDSKVSGNGCASPGDQGIGLSGDLNQVNRNISSSNRAGVQGIEVDGVSNTVTFNTTSGNNSHGVLAVGNNNNVSANTASSNTGAATNGVFVSGNSNGVGGNVGTSNGNDGILVQGTLNTIANNTGNNNVVDGVRGEAVGNIDGGGNSGAGNGGAQCVIDGVNCI